MAVIASSSCALVFAQNRSGSVLVTVLRFLTTSFLGPVCGAKTLGLVLELGRRILGVVGVVGEADMSIAGADEVKLYMFSTEAGREGKGS